MTSTGPDALEPPSGLEHHSGSPDPSGSPASSGPPPPIGSADRSRPADQSAPDGEDRSAPPPVTASLRRRLLARLLDAVVLGLPVVVVVGLLASWAATSTGAGSAREARAPLVVLLVAAPLLGLVLLGVVAVLDGRGGTPGRRWTGLRLVGVTDLAAPGTGRALVRRLVELVAGVAPLLGPVLVALSPLSDESGQRRGWPDLAAGTRVLDVRPPAPAPQDPTQQDPTRQDPATPSEASPPAESSEPSAGRLPGVGDEDRGVGAQRLPAEEGPQGG